MLVTMTVSGSISGTTWRMTASSISKMSTSAARAPRKSAPLTATEVTPCNRLEPARFCVTRLPAACASAAIMRHVVVLPLLPVTTILRAELAPTTLRNT